MDIIEFHSKMKQHCESLNGNCSQCCFLEYCYSQKRDIYNDFLSDVIFSLSKNEDSNKGTSAQVIHNHHNVFIKNH
ncbi:MAG: hypothetical protein EGR22_04095 [Ruminococcaceae bacterium]|nr:hypothetical protein [Oscillospiraceae bacterium]